jgi:hypothetical protein
MADEFGLSGVTSTVASSTGTLWTILIYGGILLIFFGMLWFIYWWTSYNIFYRIRELTGDKTRVIDDKAKRIKTKEGIIKWKLRGRNDFVPIAPAEAIHLTKRGKISVEAYYTPEHEYKYIDDEGEAKTRTQEPQYSYLLDKGISKNTVESFKSLTTADREFYANEERLAQKYLKKNWTDYILPIVGMLALIIIVVCMFAFWEDITKPTLKAQETNMAVTKLQIEMLQQIKEIMRHAQIVPDYNGTVPEPVPASLQLQTYQQVK